MPACAASSGARPGADADDREVARDLATVARPYALDALVAQERFDAGPHEHAHAVVAVQVVVHRTDLAAEHALQRHGHADR